MDGGAWWAAVYGVTQSRTRLKRLSSSSSSGVPLLGASPDGASGKESACQCRRTKRLGFDPWVWKIPWRMKWPPTPVFLPEKSHGERSLAGYSPWGHKELDMYREFTQRVAKLGFELKLPLSIVIFSWMKYKLPSLVKSEKEEANWLIASSNRLY